MRKGTVLTLLTVLTITLGGCRHDLRIVQGKTLIERVGYAPGNETARIGADGSVEYRSERGVIWEVFVPLAMVLMGKGV